MDSDISEADPQALLESLMDLDYMDTEIFGPRKPKSTTAKGSRMNQSMDPLPKAQDESTHPKMDTNGPLDHLLLEDGGLPKMSKARNAKSEPSLSKSDPASVKTNDSSVPNASPVRSPERPLTTSQKRGDLNFEEEADDIMDILGFVERPHIPPKNGDGSTRPARSKLDELLGRGTSVELLEKLQTGEKKEFKLDPKYHVMSGKEDPPSDEDFAFGSYQPTIAMNLEGQLSRPSSVRFYEDAKEYLKSDGTPVVHGPAHNVKRGADWLGLRDESILGQSPSVPELTLASGVTPSAAGSSVSETKRENRTAHLPRTIQTTPQPREMNIATQPKDEPAETPVVPLESDKWTISAFADKKSQKQEKTGEQNEQKAISRMGTTLPWESSRNVSTSNSPAVHGYKGNFETVLSGPTESHEELVEPVTSLPKVLEDRYSQREVLELHSRVLDLEAQVRKLQLEKEKQSLLLKTLQHQHKEDLELIENAHHRSPQLPT